MYTGKFLRIPQDFFKNENDNFFAIAGTKGFFVYSFLIYKQASSDTCEVTLQTLQEFLNRDYDKRPTIKYGNRTNHIELLKDYRTITKLIIGLHKLKYITIHNITEDEINNIKIRATKMLIIECNTFENGNFIAIPNQLYINNIHKIGHIGWSIFCLLSRLFNKNFGSKTCEGYANPSQGYMTSVLGLNEHTISAYSELLEKLKLIKIKPQGYIIKAEKITGEEIREYLPNNYIVNYMLTENKYYIGH